ncbi:hypothetical protein [Sulfurimonas sp.]
MATLTDFFTENEIKKIKSLQRRLNKIGRELEDLDLRLFGWADSGCIVKYSDNANGGAYVVQRLLDLKIGGGDPDYEELDNVY